MLQMRLERRDGRRALGLLAHPRFRAAYDFLLLRVEAGLVPSEVGVWWTEIQTLSAEERLERVAQLAPAAALPEEEGGAPRARRRRRPRRRRPPGQAPGPETTAE